MCTAGRHRKRWCCSWLSALASTILERARATRRKSGAAQQVLRPNLFHPRHPPPACTHPLRTSPPHRTTHCPPSSAARARGAARRGRRAARRARRPRKGAGGQRAAVRVHRRRPARRLRAARRVHVLVGGSSVGFTGLGVHRVGVVMMMMMMMRGREGNYCCGRGFVRGGLAGGGAGAERSFGPRENRRRRRLTTATIHPPTSKQTGSSTSLGRATRTS